MGRVVVEDDKGFATCRIAQTDTLLPSRMTPTLVVGILFVGIGAVVDEDIRIPDQAEDVLVETVAAVFRIGHVTIAGIADV